MIEITYGSGSAPKLDYNEIGAAGSGYNVETDGVITEIIDPQGVIGSDSGLGSSNLSLTLADKQGSHSFFVRVSKGDINTIMPVDLDIREKAEITGLTLSTTGEPVLSFGI